MSKKIRAKKKFGQNFLQDSSVIERIITAFHPQKKDTVYEIGPGQAALSELLAGMVSRLNLIEIDTDLLPALNDRFEQTDSVQVINQDALTLKLPDGENRIIGNLPYNISTPLLIHFLYQAHNITDMLFMLQKEVVKRICASPGNKTYGRLSVMLQYSFECEELFVVKPESFIPRPKVDSQIIRMTRKSEIPSVDVQALEQVVKQSFSQRRKTIKNNLKGILTEAEFDKLDIDWKLRPEILTIEQYISITNYITNR